MERSKKTKAYAALFGLLLAAAGAFCVFSAPLQASAASALRVCASSVVPSLFPFMVISSLLTQSAPFLFSGTAKKGALFGLPTASAVAVVIGAVCGFPMGVVTVAGLKRRGLLSKRQASRLAAVSNNAGPAFVAEVIGASFFGSRTFGVRLYLLQLCAAIALGTFYLALSAARDRRRGGEADRSEVRDGGGAAAAIPANARLTVIFTEAIGRSALGVIRVCAFIVFFSVLTDGAALLLPSLGEKGLAALSCVLEFTTGCRLAAGIKGPAGAAMCAFAVGFSGVSVLAQSASFAHAEDIDMRPTVLFKLCEGAVCAAIAFFAL